MQWSKLELQFLYSIFSNDYFCNRVYLLEVKFWLHLVGSLEILLGLLHWSNIYQSQRVFWAPSRRPSWLRGWTGSPVGIVAMNGSIKDRGSSSPPIILPGRTHAKTANVSQKNHIFQPCGIHSNPGDPCRNIFCSWWVHAWFNFSPPEGVIRQLMITVCLYDNHW